MRIKSRKSEMWEYLESTGVLEKGIDVEIKAAKRAYWKKYFLTYKQKQRISKPEFVVAFDKKNGEYGQIIRAAKGHKMSITAFIHSASLAYLTQTFVVPDKFQIARLEQLLSDCLNEIKTIVQSKEKYFWEREQRIERIEKRIEKLETEINEVLRNPPMNHDRQNKIT